MGKRVYLFLTGCIFGLVASAHLARLIWGSPGLQLGSWVVPIGFSWIGLPVTLSLSVWGFSLFRGKGSAV